MTTLTIYMKSGNRIRLRFIKDWKVRCGTGGLAELTIVRHPLFEWLPHPKLILSSIDLTQIEAITHVN
jgi:hypothetical protein